LAASLIGNEVLTNSIYVSGGLIVGIDASRNRSGGAVAHLKGIINGFDTNIGIAEVHVWAYQSLLDKLPDRPWLIKHHHAALEKSLLHQLWWQAKNLRKELHRIGVNVLFSTSASTLCDYKPLVVLSQDLLSYEPGVMQSYRWGLARLRLEVIKRVQNMTFRRAIGVIFLTQYARALVQSSCGQLENIAVIPHGIDEFLRDESPRTQTVYRDHDGPIRCVYVSNADLYKHQWNVVKAVHLLRDQGLCCTLTLIGGGEGPARELLDRTILECEGSEWVSQVDFLPHHELPLMLDQADIFVFASSCENLPITLLEGMAKGLPIACSNRGPMPEVLGEGGEYFDPMDFESIANAVHRLIVSPEQRLSLAKAAQARAKAYTWAACSRATFGVVRDAYFQNTINQ
jgi:glycosyltransferase involved in cell wall biosynthesis